MSTAEFSYGISEYFTGRGLAKDIISLGISAVNPGYNELIAWIACDNIGSIKSALANGFVVSNDRLKRNLLQKPELVEFIKYIRSSIPILETVEREGVL
ncbi:GNAT family N-acetyltransferase [bacterium]|nr:GNAT family N-acetyltransferase [bacterium]